MPTWSAYRLQVISNSSPTRCHLSKSPRKTQWILTTHERYWIQSDGSCLKCSLSRKRSRRFQLMGIASFGTNGRNNRTEDVELSGVASKFWMRSKRRTRARSSRTKGLCCASGIAKPILAYWLGRSMIMLQDFNFILHRIAEVLFLGYIWI